MMDTDRPSLRTNRRQALLALVLLILMLQLTGVIPQLNLGLYDAMIDGDRLPPARDLAVVAIDERSLRELGQWPWNRQVHAALIKRLDQDGVKAIAFDVLFTESSPNPSDDRALASAMRQAHNVVLPVHIYPVSAEQPLSEFLPTPELANAAAALGHVNVQLDSDEVVRGLYLRQGLGEAVWPSLAAALATLTHPEVKIPGPDVSAPPFVNVQQDYVRTPFAPSRAAIPTYSYVDVLEGRVPASLLQGKAVFVGATAAGLGDRLPTPVSGGSAPMSGVQFHANVYSALIQHRLIHSVSGLWQVLLLALVILVSLQSLTRLAPRYALPFVIGLSSLIILCSAGLLYSSSLWLPVGASVLASLLAWPVFTAQRLTLLNRFLSQQVNLLGRQSRDTFWTTRESPPQILAHLVELLLPAGWCLVEDGEVLEEKHLAPRDCPQNPSPVTGSWRHEGPTSWLRIRRGDHHFLIGLKWSTGINYRELQRYVDPLTFTDQQPLRPRFRPSERLIRKIEEVQQASVALANLYAFTTQGFAQMPNGIMVVDALGVIRFVNGHVASWLGEPQSSLPGMALAHLLDSVDPGGEHRWHDTVGDTLLHGQRRALEMRVQARDLLIELVPFTFPATREAGAIANIADVTTIRDQQRQQREAIDFISHDVRSPLVSQLALIEQLKRSGTPVEPGQLEQIAKLAKRSYQLAEEFVQLARAEQMSSVRFYECEALAIVENATDAVQEQAMAKSITLDLKGTEDLWIWGNAELLERAIINLLTNAVQHSKPGSRVHVSVEPINDSVLVSVEDNGSGIAPEDMPHLFERFRRPRQNELRGKLGTGLGLSFVKVVADKHGGEIDVSSTLDVGTTFRLWLPAATGEETTE
ncbi:CHASE2 domain-containing protein [Mangrovitalea sediminis]|uniref:CHASE2 domain-containing protein n=1 Tax=Mangrovitalea sediminis TaxID=1982043 RepID=UPI000BE57612|nr:CHASE2 domain-containing protein [Mangrovitalea sediminis]